MCLPFLTAIMLIIGSIIVRYSNYKREIRLYSRVMLATDSKETVLMLNESSSKELRQITESVLA